MPIQPPTVTSPLQRRILRVLDTRPMPPRQLLGWVDAHPSAIRREGRLLYRLGLITDRGGRLALTEAGAATLEAHYGRLRDTARPA